MKNIKTLLIFMSLVLISFSLIGCSGMKSQMSYDEAARSSAESPKSEESIEFEDASLSGSPLQPEKIIITIELQLETIDFNGTISELEKIIDKYKAYVEHSNMSHSSRNYKNADFIIRVSKDSVQSFKNEIGEIGNKIWESTNKEDVTKHYTDTESRLRIIETKEARILALMEKANKIEDIIVLENQLSETVFEKEKLKSNLINLDDQIDFSTINLYIREVDKLTSSTSPNATFGNKVLDTISNSLYFFKNTLENTVISLIYVMPFIVILFIIGFFIYKGIRKFKRQKKDK